MLIGGRLVGLLAGFFFGIVVHEYAHAKMADLLGDRYPRMQGRLTVRPKPHVDTVGTLIMPAVFIFLSLIGQPFGMVFGYAKPIQRNPRAFKRQRRDEILVAVAGPAVNALLVAAGGIAGAALLTPSGFLRPTSLQDAVGIACLYLMSVNAFILVVNLFPVPPLDGSKALMPFLSPSTQMKMDEYSQHLLLFVVVLFFFLQGALGAMANPLCRAATGGALFGCPL